MRTQIKRSLSMVLALFLLVGSVAPVIAATYRPGAQSGPSDSYAGSMYYSNLKRVPITGDNRTDLIAIALSQLGYQEGAANGSFSGEVSGRANYVEFSYNLGDLGLGYGGSDYPWCACFVTWCLHQSHCTDQATYKDLVRFHNGDYKYIWKEISCSQWVRQLKGAGYYRYSTYQGGSYTPQSGDLVFFQNSGGVAHIGICLYTADGRIYTVEGNTSDSAGLETNGGGVYFKNYSLSTSYINGYGVLPYTSERSVAQIDYSGSNPTPGLYVSNAVKYIYASETDSSHSWIMDRFTMFEVTQVCSNGRLRVNALERGGSTVTGYVSNNSDRVIQLSTTATEAQLMDTSDSNTIAQSNRDMSYSLEEPSEPGYLSSVVLSGDFNSWNYTPNMRVVDDRKVTTTVTLEAGSYAFKVQDSGEWFGNNDTIQDTTGATPWVMDTAAGSCVIHASRTGNYVFTFDRDTKELVVAYTPDILYLRGSFNNWGTMLPMNNNGDGTCSTTIALAAGRHEFKVANEDYTAQWPQSNYVLELDQTSNVTITLDSYSNTLTVSSNGTATIVTFADRNANTTTVTQ